MVLRDVVRGVTSGKVILKRAADTFAGHLQAAEEALWLDEDAVVLQGFERSLQLDTYSCGAQSTFMILRWFGRARSPAAVGRELGTNENGTPTGAILRVLRRRGLAPRVRARARLRDLEEAVDRGTPVLVSMDGSAHWAVVYGYSKQAIHLADPNLLHPWTIVPRAAFRARWDRWVMLVRRPPARRKPRRPPSARPPRAT